MHKKKIKKDTRGIKKKIEEENNFLKQLWVAMSNIPVEKWKPFIMTDKYHYTTDNYVIELQVQKDLAMIILQSLTEGEDLLDCDLKEEGGFIDDTEMSFDSFYAVGISARSRPSPRREIYSYAKKVQEFFAVKKKEKEREMRRKRKNALLEELYLSLNMEKGSGKTFNVDEFAKDLDKQIGKK
jgi:hypothetical protein